MAKAVQSPWGHFPSTEAVNEEALSNPPVLPINRGPTLWDLWTERNLESLWNQLFLHAPRIKLPDQTTRKLLNLPCTHWIYRFIGLTFPVFVQ